MLIQRLKIDNLRVIEQSDTTPGTGLNLFTGHNGAGKTTLLEALAILARGRSFRSGSVSAQIGGVTDHYTLLVDIERASGQTHRLGLSRSRSGWKARCDGRDITQLTELSALLPVISMHPENYSLVSGPPEGRRRYLDWGVFHVKHGFLDDWRRYSRALSQRNAAIRQGASAAVVDSLTPELVSHGNRLDEVRRDETERLSQRLKMILPELSGTLGEIEIAYHPGWSATDFESALVDALQTDRERGWTSVGPHRAELVFRTDGRLARDRLSRGEQKLLYVALNIAQAGRLAETGEIPVMLIDDLASEFDEDHLDRVLDYCLAMGGQLWVTGTSTQGFSEQRLEKASVFHVKHGVVSAAT
ncbi:DNA replication/repair protein RecF [Marinihelvus fidelis]|uniref:DNA replication and repair protein RecF n=1 Tax=Marinihelvus fidelis TaxID=2613842 RepID=A0A5N0T8X9_9GAMM|nr:DNA replication/repair protein RecF [Marinihelvus fidelis]KAA9131493.1 DNA replication/repair protein RecF [Marinihelvus fidelis]